VAEERMVIHHAHLTILYTKGYIRGCRFLKWCIFSLTIIFVAAVISAPEKPRLTKACSCCHD